MAHAIPEYLIRVSSDGSHGSHGPKLFSPAAHSGQNLLKAIQYTPDSIKDFKDQLSKSLAWKDITNCPFIPFTDSLLFALQFACRGRALGEQNIHITLIKTATAMTPSGERVKFYPVQSLLKQYYVRVRKDSAGIPYQYKHEYVAMCPIVPGEGSCYIRLETPNSNILFDLYPALHEANERSDPRLQLTYGDLQQYGFENVRMLKEVKINLAVKLAFSFVDCATGDALQVPHTTRKHLLAAFLGLQKRSKDDAILQEWLERCSEPGNCRAHNNSLLTKTSTNDNEIEQYRELIDLFSNLDMNKVQASSTSSTSPTDTRAERADWRSWWAMSRDTYKVPKEARDDYHGGSNRQEYRAAREAPRDSQRRRNRGGYRAAREANGRLQGRRDRSNRSRSPDRGNRRYQPGDERRRQRY